MIIGGRQSAFEWAALLADGDAEAVHVVYRHDTPEFTASDWHFADGMMDLTATVPGWFRHLPPEEREAVGKRFWAEGRLKLEPWLTPRLEKPSVHRWPRERVVACGEAPGGEIEAELSDGTRLVVDHVVLATGYKPDMRKVPYLAGVVDEMDLVDGFPSWTSTSSRACPASSSQGSRPRGTSGRSSASYAGAPWRPRSPPRV